MSKPIKYLYVFLFCSISFAATDYSLPETRIKSLTFSDDGSKVAYIKESYSFCESNKQQVIQQNLSLHWLNIDRPKKIFTSQIIKLVSESPNDSVNIARIRWSPDGSKIGVQVLDQLQIISADGKRKKTIQNGTIDSFRWIDDSRMAYITEKPIRLNSVSRSNYPNYPKSRQFFYTCDSNGNDRKEIASFVRRPTKSKDELSPYLPGITWSPSGRKVFFASLEGNDFVLLDFYNDKVIKFLQPNFYYYSISWSPNSKYVYVDWHEKSFSKTYTILIDTASGKVTDLTDKFIKNFGKKYYLGSQWTSDSKYILVHKDSDDWNHRNAADTSLVNPIIWKIVPLPEDEKQNKIIPKNSKDKFPVTSRNTKGLRRGFVDILNDEILSNSSSHPQWSIVQRYGYKTVYAQNYFTDELRPLFSAEQQGWDKWELSPDSTHAAIITKDNKIRIESLGKWWLSK